MTAVSRAALALLLSAALLALSKGYTVPYVPDSEENCKDGETEYFNKEAQHCCSKCPPGTHLKQQCSASRDTVCEPCREGTYTDRWHYHWNCLRCEKKCTALGLVEVQTCMTTSNRKCVCPVNTYCSLRFGLNKSCENCSPFSICPAAHGVLVNANEDSDVKCAPCPTGTFSATPSSTEACQPHTDCASLGKRALTPGNATADAECGDWVRVMPDTATLSGHPARITTPPSPAGSSSAQPDDVLPVAVCPEVAGLTSPSCVKKHIPKIIAGAACLLAVLAIVIFACILVKRHKARQNRGSDAEEFQDLKLPPELLQQNPSYVHPPNPEQQCLLGEKDSSSPSLSCASSQSDSSYSSGVGSIQQNGQEGLSLCKSPETPSTTSPQMQVSIEATIKYHLQTAGSCCAPPASGGGGRNPDTQSSDSGVPLSQEETYINLQPSQCEEDKDARLSEQESKVC